MMMMMTTMMMMIMMMIMMMMMILITFGFKYSQNWNNHEPKQVKELEEFNLL